MTIVPIIGLLAGASMTAAIINAPPSIPCMCFAIIPLIAISHELYTVTLLFHTYIGFTSSSISYLVWRELV